MQTPSAKYFVTVIEGNDGKEVHEPKGYKLFQVLPIDVSTANQGTRAYGRIAFIFEKETK